MEVSSNQFLRSVYVTKLFIFQFFYVRPNCRIICYVFIVSHFNLSCFSLLKVKLKTKQI